jgi:hypothetical protein
MFEQLGFTDKSIDSLCYAKHTAQAVGLCFSVRLGLTLAACGLLELILIFLVRNVTWRQSLSFDINKETES